MIKRIASLGIAAALMLGLCACVPTPPPMETASSEPTPAFEEANPLLEDYDTFWRILEENYASYAAAERITGEDFQKLKATYRAVAAEAEDAAELEDILYWCAYAFQGTGHFWMVTTSSYARVIDQWGDSGDRKSEYLFDKLNNPQSRAFYGYQEPQNSPAAGGPPSTEGGASTSGNLIFGDYPEDKAAYVEILKMNGNTLAQDKAELNTFFARLEAEGYTDCIVDIRRNGGGGVVATDWRPLCSPT